MFGSQIIYSKPFIIFCKNFGPPSLLFRRPPLPTIRVLRVDLIDHCKKIKCCKKNFLWRNLTLSFSQNFFHFNSYKPIFKNLYSPLPPPPFKKGGLTLCSQGSLWPFRIVKMYMCCINVFTELKCLYQYFHGLLMCVTKIMW